MAEKYIKAFEQLAKQGNTLILPSNAGDISHMVAQVRIHQETSSIFTWRMIIMCVRLQAMSIYKTVGGHQPANQSNAPKSLGGSTSYNAALGRASLENIENSPQASESLEEQTNEGELQEEQVRARSRLD